MGDGEQINQTIGVSREGVTLSKQFGDDDEFPVPTVRFRVVNNREERMFVRLVETVPEGFSKDAIGFTPDHGGEDWHTVDDRAVFERELDPDETAETLYAVRIDDESRAGEFMTEPELAVVQPAAEPRDPVGPAESGSEGEADATMDLEVDEDAGGRRDDRPPLIESVDLREVDVDLPPSAHVDGPETGTVVARLVEELSRGDVDPEHRIKLREELDLGVPTEVVAQIEQLQSRVETVTAYTEGLEEFLDEEGAAQELIRDYKTQVQTLREDVATLRQHTRSNAGGITSLTENLDDLVDHVADVEARLDDVADHADTLEASLEETDDNLDGVETALDDAVDRIEDNADGIADLESETDDLRDDVAAVEGRVSDAEADIESVDADVEAVEDRVTDAESGIEDLADETDGLAAEIGTVEDRVTDTEADIYALDNRMTGTEQDVETLESATAANARAVGAVESDVDGLAEDIDGVADRVSTTEDDITGVETYVERVETDLEGVEDRVGTTEEALDAVDDRVTELEEGLQEFQNWRDELGEMFT